MKILSGPLTISKSIYVDQMTTELRSCLSQIANEDLVIIMKNGSCKVSADVG